MKESYLALSPKFFKIKNMKIENIRTLPGSAVRGQTEVIISIDPEQAQELKKALAIVHQYENAAMKAICLDKKITDPRLSDWHKTSYAVKNDKVIVMVEDGMCG